MRFCWCDIETTGLGKDCSIIEIACLITDEKFEVIDSFRELVKPHEANWSLPALEMHIDNGLVRDLLDEGSALDLRDVERLFKMFLSRNLPDNEFKYYLAGSSVHFDHSVIERSFDKEINDMFSHKHLDVTSISIAVTAINGPSVARQFQSENESKTKHRAMDDIKWSLDYFKDAKKRGLIGLLN